MFSTDLFSSPGSGGLYAPGSGLGPQAGGYAPTPQEAMQAILKQQSSQQLMEYAVRSDPRTKALAGMVAKALAGDNATATSVLNNSKTGQFIKDGASFLMQSGLMPGGNPANLAVQVQNMMASQGFRFGGNIGLGGQNYGSGAFTDTASKMMFESIRKEFYNPVTGLSNANAAGLDMSQMSDAMGYLTSRGAFRGMDLGKIKYFNDPKDIAMSRAQAEREGDKETVSQLDAITQKGGAGFVTSFNKPGMKRVTDMFKNYASMLRDAKEVFGDLSGGVGALTQNAERLVGTSVAEFGALETMRSRMSSIRTTSMAYGLDPKAVASQSMETTDQLRMVMLRNAASDPRNRTAYGQAALGSDVNKTAAAIGNAATLNSIHGSQALEAYAVAAKNAPGGGRYVRTFTQQQIQASSAELVNQLMGEESTGNQYATLAMSLVGNKTITGDKATEINTLLSDLGKNGNKEQTIAINTKIKKAMEDSGLNVEKILNNTSLSEITGGMSLPTSQKMVSTYQAQAAARSISHLTYLKNTGLDSGILSGEGAPENMFKLLRTLDAPALTALTAAIDDNGVLDTKKIDALYKEHPGLRDYYTQTELKQSVESLTKSKSLTPGTNGKQAFTGVIDKFKSAAINMDVGASAMEVDKARQRGMQQYIESIRSGGPMTEESFAEEIMRGFFDQGQISDAAAMQYLTDNNAGGVASIQLSKDASRLQLKEEDIEGKLIPTMGTDKVAQLFAAFAIKPGDNSALAAAMSKDARGLEEMTKLKGGEIFRSKGTPGNNDQVLDIASETAATGAKTAVEKEAIKKQAALLLGQKINGTTLPYDKLETPEDVAAYQQTVQKTILDNPDRLKELITNANNSDFSGSEFKALAAEYKKSPELGKRLADMETAAADKWKASGFNETAPRDELRNIKSLRSKLGDQGADKFLGVLELVGLDKISMKLFNNN